MSEFFDILKQIPIPYKELLLATFIVASSAYRIYKKLEPYIRRKTLTKQTVEDIASYAAQEGVDSDSPLFKVIQETKERYVFYRLSGIDVKEPLRTMLAKIYLALPQTDWASIREARPYIKTDLEDESAVSIRVPWIDRVGNGISLITAAMLAIFSVMIMSLILGIYRDAQTIVLLFIISMLSLGGALFFFVYSMPPIRAIQLRSKIKALNGSPLRLANAKAPEELSKGTNEKSSETRSEVKEHSDTSTLAIKSEPDQRKSKK